MTAPRSVPRFWPIACVLAAALILPGAEGARFLRIRQERAAQLQVEQALGATVERKQPSSFFGHGRSPLVVTSVAAAGPARDAGLRAGDVILTTDGRPVDSPSDLAHGLAGPGLRSRFAVDRHGARFQMLVSRRGPSVTDDGGAPVPQAADSGR